MGMVWVTRLVDADTERSLRADPDRIDEFVDVLGEDDTLEFDKEWHAVHYLLTGSAEPTASPLSLILGNFEPVGDDLGYGPAWYVPPAFIASFDAAIAAITNADLTARFDVDAMIRDQVYIAEALKDDGPESLVYLLEHVDRMRAWAATGKAKSMGAFGLIS